MTRQRKITLAKTGLIIGVLPILLWAHYYGPDPGYVGVPGENGGATCATSGCHSGTANSFSSGSVNVSFPNGTTYTPGEAQTVTVTVADPTEKAAGFQLTARQTSSPSTMAGTFAANDSNTQVVCSQTNLQVFIDVSNSSQCRAGYTLQYIEHSLAGFNSSVNHLPYTYTFTWTPPSTNIGNITIYVAANAGVGNPPSQDGDHIYSKTYTLTPSTSGGGGTPPSIQANGIVNGASFATGISPGSWMTIQGSNLASVTDTWANAIINGALPTKLDGVSVSVGGEPAYVYYISPTQINVLAPNVSAGAQQVTVTTGAGSSSATSVTAQTYQPAFFLWPGGYAVATRQDFTYAINNGTFSGVTTTPAKPGDVIILWGTGFGPTNPSAPDGMQVPATATYNTAPVSVMVGGQAAIVYGSALAPGFAGLYQIAIQVPTSLANGDYPVIATVGGQKSPSSTLLTVHN